MAARIKIDSIRASLKERIKELECLYSISQIINEKQNSPLEDLFYEILSMIPRAWQYPELTSARIQVDGFDYITANYNHPFSYQNSAIIVKNKLRGFVEAAYSKEMPACDEGPFLKEERALIDAIAKKLIVIIERAEDRKEKEMLESKLMHADRLATIGEFTAGIAHELNEPIASVLGFAQLIKKDQNIDSRIIKDVDKIIQASIHAREIIRKLMSFSKYDDRPGIKVNLNKVITDAFYLLETRCKKEQIEIVKTLEADLPGILANPLEMSQVVVNLCVNSIQAMPSGGTLLIHTYSGQERVMLVVQDTGTGISEDNLSRIFDPFFTTKDAATNTGLGLSVVHGIVTSFKGYISVESHLGVGTRFEISFPMNET